MRKTLIGLAAVLALGEVAVAAGFQDRAYVAGRFALCLDGSVAFAERTIHVVVETQLPAIQKLLDEGDVDAARLLARRAVERILTIANVATRRINRVADAGLNVLERLHADIDLLDEFQAHRGAALAELAAAVARGTSFFDI